MLSMNGVISGPTIQEETGIIAQGLGRPDFQASQKQWLFTSRKTRKQLEATLESLTQELWPPSSLAEYHADESVRSIS